MSAAVTTLFVLLLALALLAAARERRQGRDPGPAVHLLAIVTVAFAVTRCSH